MSPRLVLLVFASLWLFASTAAAADPCQALPAQAAQSQDASQRIAAAACTEHRAWFRPLIDVDGRIGAMKVREAERTRLADGQPAWQRVVEYWRGSGLLWQAGAGDCAYTDVPGPSCRAFVVDTPWSAAFVSWVLRKARLPGFDGSASHLHYVRRAYREPFLSPYRVADPRAAQVRTGDMLCYVRGTARTYGFGALATLLSGNEPGLAMHCDVVVGITVAPDHARTAHLVGGNVYDSVTMRRLRLTQGDRFADLPMRLASDPECSPESPYACDLNRQDWSVLLQLRPGEELAGLTPASTMPVAPGTYASGVPGSPAIAPGATGPAGLPTTDAPATPRCCNHCDPEVGLPRCPAAPARPATP
ncbi:DUF2272 domain-containing protein [Luteimonas kalidii]|uniref:DUF2272 domain-containing protein n=1 Tax=Luteimonas kalidii TaxID=3042025 RepID=A0ABT6JSE8_9GAMM|nr:DUF2272 domain-containing protein [Luteimonas kalidii]MDH5833613.1 DUF2272 domain-containing protein [Luteimonas kalidii]